MLPADLLHEAHKLQQQGKALALATVVRTEASTSAKAGAKALVDADGTISGWVGGGCAQPAVVKAAQLVLADQQPRLIRVSPKSDQAQQEGIINYASSCSSGGTLDIFIEPMSTRHVITIFGSSPLAADLAKLCPLAGFEARPGATEAEAPAPAPTPFAVVVATQGRGDLPALRAALSSEAQHILFVASANKSARLRQQLVEQGHDPERVASVKAPCGVDIGASTPAEIAFSVVAELIRLKNSPKEQ